MEIIDYGDISSYTEQMKLIQGFTKSLRNLRPHIKSTWKEPSDWVVKESNINGDPATVLSITLMPTGCAWASRGGCTMCGEFEGSTKGEAVSGQFHMAQFSSAISKYFSKYRPSWLRIYQEGNYINEDEIEETVQFKILQLSSLLKGVKRITIESMAKYITPEKAKKIRKAVNSDIEIEVGMGFEAQNDIVRNVCVNKGESIKDFEKAVGSLKEKGIRSVAYVLLKPPFLSEREAIFEAISTIEKAKEIGFSAISLEPLSIHGYTLVHALNLADQYKAPWLWSIIEVVKHIKDINDFRIGGVGFFPRPLSVAHNRNGTDSNFCNCSQYIWETIREYGRMRDFSVFNDLECSCKEDWKKICKSSINSSLKDRINHQLSKLDVEKYKKAILIKDLRRQSVVEHTTAIAGGTQYSEK